jgi:hypothetical protein
METMNTATFVISSGARLREVVIVRRRQSQRGILLTVRSLRDAGADQRGLFEPLTWAITTRGDFAVMLASIFEERKIS